MRGPIENQAARPRGGRGERHRLATRIPARRRRNPRTESGSRSASPPHCRYCRALRCARRQRTGPRHRARAAGRRKIVLSTRFAETPLTIEGVRVVIDSGLSRLPRYEPRRGLTRLETVRVSRASADQRRGRAGRTEPGVATGCGRAADRVAEPTRGPKFYPPTSRRSCSTGALGVGDPATLALPRCPTACGLERSAHTPDRSGRDR